jgi:hypothetical protein
MIERSAEDLTGYYRSNLQRYRKTGLAPASWPAATKIKELPSRYLSQSRISWR